MEEPDVFYTNIGYTFVIEDDMPRTALWKCSKCATVTVAYEKHQEFFHPTESYDLLD
jgi:hypothetical protein